MTGITEKIPTDYPALYELLNRTDHSEWYEIADQLGQQIGDMTKAHQLVDPITDDILNDRQIVRLRAELHENFKAAQAAVRDVHATLNQLSGNEVFDPEYAETAVAGDMCHFLEEAARALRAANALNPCPPR